MKNKIVIYPKLPSKLHFIIRFMGSGLANCLFVYARAIILANKYKLEIINPSWIQFNIGPYIRREKDKRHYNGLFNSFGIKNINKQWLLLTQKGLPENSNPSMSDQGIIVVEGLKNYFTDLHFQSDLVKNHLLGIVNNDVLECYKSINKKFVGVHIRLGDYDIESRISFTWYLEKMKFLHEIYDSEIEFLIFSDGSADELSEVLNFPNTTLVFFGSAIADILVLSKAKFIIASDSTFSAWSAYLGQVPILFYKRHFGNVLDNPDHEWVQSDFSEENIYNSIKKILN
ncbi:MAG: alpha-1,2-fucosyltransferase [Lutibacter sp.]